jgi:hypothetical protein
MNHQMTSPFILKRATEETLEAMSRMEEEIRMSQEYLDECTKVKSIPDGWLTVTANMQKKVAANFGFTDEINNEIACNDLRRAHIEYPDNLIFKQSVQVRCNKANIGTLQDGDTVPNVLLHTVDNLIIGLNDLLQENKINIFFGASHT